MPAPAGPQCGPAPAGSSSRPTRFSTSTDPGRQSAPRPGSPRWRGRGQPALPSIQKRCTAEARTLTSRQRRHWHWPAAAGRPGSARPALRPAPGRRSMPAPAGQPRPVSRNDAQQVSSVDQLQQSASAAAARPGSPRFDTKSSASEQADPCQPDWPASSDSQHRGRTRWHIDASRWQQPQRRQLALASGQHR